MILIIIKFGEVLLCFSPKIINALRSYIKHSKESFIRYPNTSKLVKKTRLRLVFSIHFLVFGYLMKHSSSCLIYYLKIEKKIEIGTLPNIRFCPCFQDQILPTNCAENQGSWNGSSPIKPTILHEKLLYHHMLVTASLLFRERTFFTKVFSSFRGRFRKGCRREKSCLLKFGSWRERRRPLTQAPSFVDVAVAPTTSSA